MSEANQIKLCSVVGYYRFLFFNRSRILIEFSVKGFDSLIIINYGTKYNLSFWYHTTKYINVLKFSLDSDQVYAMIYKNHSKIDQVCASFICTNHSKINNLTKYLITINLILKIA